MSEHKTIDSFNGKHEFLSNFYIWPMTWQGKKWMSSEHVYQAMKTLDETEREWIRAAKLPGIAKNRGNNRKLDSNDPMRCTLQPGWDKTKNDVMYEVVSAKFSDPHLAALLRNTGDAELIEGNWWNDTWFGVCKGKGHNYLGKILMRVRSEL